MEKGKIKVWPGRKCLRYKACIPVQLHHKLQPPKVTTEIIICSHIVSTKTQHQHFHNTALLHFYSAGTVALHLCWTFGQIWITASLVEKQCLFVRWFMFSSHFLIATKIIIILISNGCLQILYILLIISSRFKQNPPLWDVYAWKLIW